MRKCTMGAVLTGLVVLGIALSACGTVRPAPTATPVPTPVPTSAPTTAATGVEWKTLTSDTDYFEMEYPATWDAGVMPGLAYVQKDEETFLVIEITTTLPVADPDEAERMLTEEVIGAIRSDDANAKVTGPDTLSIGGEEGYYADFVYVDPASKLENMATAVNVYHQGNMYKFILFTLTTDAAENNPLFIAMLRSFRFTR
ncbi:MAG: hypothetical protein ACP5SI_04930 [Chloroflexia bacterium]